MGDNSCPNQVTVLVTGFGPFAMHTVNASWSAVTELLKMGLGIENVKLIAQEIEVEYDTVTNIVPQLWNKYKPQLTVHVGVSGIAKQITLEQQAHNQGYNKPDVCGCTPEGECCKKEATECICSGIDMQDVCDFVNRSSNEVIAVISNDPGRYLCEFIYYTSLSINSHASAFIHVPPLDRPFSAQQLAEGIRLAIVAMLTQLQLI